jgi:hypothetical protein
MPIAAEEEHRKIEDGLPLPELVNRAEALQGMLEKGHHPHHSFISASTVSKGSDDVDQELPIASAPLEMGPRESRHGTGAAVNFTGFLSRARKGDPGRNGARGPRSVPPDSPKIKHMPMTKKQRMTAIGCIAVVLLALVLGIGLGMGLTRKHKPPNCPGNFTGNACNLGE